MSDEHEHVHERDRMDRPMTYSEQPLSYAHSDDVDRVVADDDVYLSDTEEDSESHSSDDCEDEALYGDAEFTSSSPSFSSSSSSHERLRRIQAHQQQQRMRGKSMGPTGLFQVCR